VNNFFLLSPALITLEPLSIFRNSSYAISDRKKTVNFFLLGHLAEGAEFQFNTFSRGEVLSKQHEFLGGGTINIGRESQKGIIINLCVCFPIPFPRYLVSEKSSSRLCQPRATRRKHYLPVGLAQI
jgi:hypothetical protein